jgi:small multidrug resistance pump
MKLTLILAGIYNILWGTSVILFPKLHFDMIGMEVPNYLEFWQCIGMIVGVYGIGYIVASSDPIRHWPITLVGLIGKILGPIGFIDAINKNKLPIEFGWNIITNDIIWWLPFSYILLCAWRNKKDFRSDA